MIEYSFLYYYIQMNKYNKKKEAKVLGFYQTDD